MKCHWPNPKSNAFRMRSKRAAAAAEVEGIVRFFVFVVELWLFIFGVALVFWVEAAKRLPPFSRRCCAECDTSLNCIVEPLINYENVGDGERENGEMCKCLESR